MPAAAKTCSSVPLMERTIQTSSHHSRTFLQCRGSFSLSRTSHETLRTGGTQKFLEQGPPSLHQQRRPFQRAQHRIAAQGTSFCDCSQPPNLPCAAFPCWKGQEAEPRTAAKAVAWISIHSAGQEMANFVFFVRMLDLALHSKGTAVRPVPTSFKADRSRFRGMLTSLARCSPGHRFSSAPDHQFPQPLEPTSTERRSAPKDNQACNIAAAAAHNSHPQPP